jgi:exportin-2 (importin alpha re-exporter)
LQLFHDLSAQDLPPLFEDNLQSIFALLLKYLNPRASPDGMYLKNPALAQVMDGADDETSPQDGQKIRAEICSIGELYAQRYLDAAGSLIPGFVESVWEMLGRCGQGEKEDIVSLLSNTCILNKLTLPFVQLVSRAISFLSTVVKMPSQRQVFSSDGTLEVFVSGIILPNISLREQDEEMFEDEPLEWIRREFALDSGDADTRRRAASSFSRALLDQFSTQTTSIISRYINEYLRKYRENPQANWRHKDTAVYLLTSIATTSSTAAHGVSSTNELVDVVQFFADNVFADLQGNATNVHPILQVDAIKYLHTFRNQLTREQLLSVLPLLVRHLESPSYVTSSYAAITIERILFLKAPQSNTTALFTPDDVEPFAESILMALFRNIQGGATPEKIAENDYLMRCVMRLIVTARGKLLRARGPVLSHLSAILGEILKNPSNPKFSQYCFESISALIRCVADRRKVILLLIYACLSSSNVALSRQKTCQLLLNLSRLSLRLSWPSFSTMCRVSRYLSMSERLEVDGC